MPNLVNPNMLKRGTRKCSTCQQDKPLSNFTTFMAGSRGGKDRGLYIKSDCRECDTLKSRARACRKENNNPTRSKPNECEVCGSQDELCGDHCHITGLFRGWICRTCNSTLGWAKDDVDRLRNLADYLEKFYRSSSVLALLRRQKERINNFKAI